MTKKHALKNHRKMWHWIADETRKRKTTVNKQDYANECDDGLYLVPGMCYLCGHARQTLEKYRPKPQATYCQSCPVRWPDEKRISERNQSLPFCIRPFEKPSPFDEWQTAVGRKDWENAAKYAEQIAELPEITKTF